jgi:hypothetical protein
MEFYFVKSISVLFSALFLILSSFSHADTSFGNEEISTIGSHDGNTMFLTVKSNSLANMGCNYSVVYCAESRPTCKSMLSLAMVAKSTGAKVDLAVTKDATNGCNLQMMVLK